MHLTSQWQDSGGGAWRIPAVTIAPADGPMLIGNAPIEIRYTIAVERPSDGGGDLGPGYAGQPLMLGPVGAVRVETGGPGRLWLKAGPGGQVDVAVERV